MAERCASYLMIQAQYGYDVLIESLPFFLYYSMEFITILSSNFTDTPKLLICLWPDLRGNRSCNHGTLWFFFPP